MEIRRGDLVVVALPGDYGKPRPALVVQADAYRDLSSVTLLRLTSELHAWPAFRVTVEPDRENGLRRLSQVMVDKSVSAPREKIGQRLGRLDASTMAVVDAALSRFLGLDE
jgi:mRNA interferase MazF